LPTYEETAARRGSLIHSSLSLKSPKQKTRQGRKRKMKKQHQELAARIVDAEARYVRDNRVGSKAARMRRANRLRRIAKLIRSL
jgi:hypothetical protein